MDMTITEGKTPSQDNGRWCIKPSTIVHILVMIFGTSSWIGVNGIFIQLPVLVNSLPERWKLAAYLVIVIQAANLVPIAYSVLRKFKFKISESNCVFGMLGINSFVMILLAFLYNRTSTIAGSEHSLALFILTFFTAAVSCTSSILFMPYMRNFKEIYLVSYFIGEGLSGVMPSIVALIQSIGDNSNCNNITQVSHITFPRFSSQYYFLLIFGCLVLSSISFFLLENLSFIKKERACFSSSENNSSNNEIEGISSQRQKSVLSEQSITENDVIGNHVFIQKYMKPDTGKTRNIRNQLKLKTLYLYILLSMVCLLGNGLLPSLQPYSCMSYGNMTYHLSAIFSQIANPTACLLALWFLPQNIKIINWLSIVICFLSSCVMYLAFNSVNSPLQDSRAGQILVILFWVLLIGFISYVKLIITSVFRRKSEKSLFLVGVAMQVGSACGAILSFILINFTKLLQEFKPC
jgi:riboflavin transporter 2